MSAKKKLGQFYTTNYKYILQNFVIPKNQSIIEPFAGNGDLLQFIDIPPEEIECYDIDPKKDYIVERNTLLNPPSYDNKFVITNPPYLARNKSADKSLFDLYNQNDLYKCFINTLILSDCVGGILIIPLNFWCSIRKNDIKFRQEFLNRYTIVAINIFEERVFNDTSYTICSFQFKSGCGIGKTIKCFLYPSKKEIDATLNKDNNFLFGGEIYSLPQDKNIKVERATSKTSIVNTTNILLKCIDNNRTNRIGLTIVDDTERDKFIDTSEKLSARAYAILVTEPKLDSDQQKKLVDDFNKYINTLRDDFNSLFLSNYRESNDIARKRISFKLANEIVNYLLQ